jgi:hypothetical protein
MTSLRSRAEKLETIVSDYRDEDHICDFEDVRSAIESALIETWNEAVEECAKISEIEAPDDIVKEIRKLKK